MFNTEHRDAVWRGTLYVTAFRVLTSDLDSQRRVTSRPALSKVFQLRHNRIARPRREGRGHLTTARDEAATLDRFARACTAASLAIELRSGNMSIETRKVTRHRFADPVRVAKPKSGDVPISRPIVPSPRSHHCYEDGMEVGRRLARNLDVDGWLTADHTHFRSVDQA